MYLPQIQKIGFDKIKLFEWNNLIYGGAVYTFEKDELIDWSFFIHPDFQKRGFARSFVRQQLIQITNLQYTVSKFNKAS
jgi:hypothetical protein